jgi:ketosteroid isomerase-like protein
MAIQQFDAFGNYTGGYGLLDDQETEEERRRRLAREASNTLIGKTELETYADGSQTRKITQEIPAAQPVGQGIQVAGPMDPAVFDRMIQAESGGRQFDRQGGVLTSPRGALGVGQVMPATAAQPGYGVPSIFDLAERRGITVPSRDSAGASQLLANPELNREFAQNYATAMSQRFGQQGGVAAYNAGPGRVQSNMQANAGQLNAQALPQETQGYLDRVLGGIRQGASAVANAIIPSAQAATPAAAGPVDPAEQRRRAALAQRPPLPGQAPGTGYGDDSPELFPTTPPQAAPTAPTPPVSPYSLAAGMPAQPGIRVPGMAVGQTAQPSIRAIDRYQQVQDDPMELMRLRRDETQPEFIRERAGNRAYELMDAEIKRKEGEAQAQALAQAAAGGDRRASMTLAKELQKQEGSWLKFALLGFISPDLAGQELMKLGFGSVDKPTLLADGSEGIVTYRADGTPIKGITANGTAMTVKQLAQVARGLGKGVSTSAEVYVDKTTRDRYRSAVDSQGNTALVNIQGGAPFTGDPRNLVVQSIGTALAKAEGQEAIKLNYIGPIAYTREGAEFAGRFNAENPGANIGYQTQTPGAPLVDLNTGQPVTRNADGTITVTRTAPAEQQAPAAAQAAPAATQAAPAATQAAPAATQAAPAAQPAATQAPRFREPGFETETPGQFEARKKLYEKQATQNIETNKPTELQAKKNAAQAKSAFPFVGQIRDLIDKSTGSGIGAMVDSAGNFFGYSTSGATAIAEIAPLAAKILSSVERFEGPQSDRDVEAYKEAAGKLADPKIPPAQKQAAFRTIVEILRRNAPELDWSKYDSPQSSGTTSSGNRYRRVP